MNNKKVIDSKLAQIAIQKWKFDRAIREQFKTVSEYYEFLRLETENINIQRQERLENIQGILTSEFTSDELEDAINNYCVKYNNGLWRGRSDYSYRVFFSKLGKKICITNMPKSINDITVEELISLKNSLKKGKADE